MAVKPHILVVDDEPVVRESLRDWFTQDGYPVEIAASAHEALQKLKESSWDILVTDIKMPGMDGLELQSRVKEIDPNIAIIIMTAYASLDTAIQAIKEGAYDYVTKPLDPENLEQIVNRAAERQALMRENVELRERIEAATEEPGEIVGESAAIQRVREQIQGVAPTNACVLISGEDGTGKELVARAIHRSSPQCHMPLVTVPGGPPEEMRMDLFGHEPGGVAGAQYRRRGKLELADQGMVFVEEVAELGARLQEELVRVLQERRVARLGGSEPIPVDVRLVGATTRDLGQAVEQGRCSRQLYDRLSECHIAMPPLRERRSDIPLLARHFLEVSARESGAAARRISTDAMQRLMEYPWPGNVRELRNVIERAEMLEPGEEIGPRDLPLGPAPEARPALSLAEVEKQHIQSVLAQTSGDVSKAAQLLEIDEKTLEAKLQQLGIGRRQE